MARSLRVQEQARPGTQAWYKSQLAREVKRQEILGNTQVQLEGTTYDFTSTAGIGESTYNLVEAPKAAPAPAPQPVSAPQPVAPTPPPEMPQIEVPSFEQAFEQAITRRAGRSASLVGDLLPSFNQGLMASTMGQGRTRRRSLTALDDEEETDLLAL